MTPSRPRANPGPPVAPGSPTADDGRYADPLRGHDARSGYAERVRPYWPWALVGLLGPFALAAPIYPLAALFVHHVLLPPTMFAWEALSRISVLLFTSDPAWLDAPRPDFSPAGFWASTREVLRVLSAGLAFLCARWLVRRVEGGHFPPRSPAERGFTAGLRAAILVAILAVLCWLNVRVVGA